MNQGLHHCDVEEILKPPLPPAPFLPFTAHIQHNRTTWKALAHGPPSILTRINLDRNFNRRPDRVLLLHLQLSYN
jgi:hypothetical protein